MKNAELGALMIEETGPELLVRMSMHASIVVSYRTCPVGLIDEQHGSCMMLVKLLSRGHQTYQEGSLPVIHLRFG